MGGFFEQKFRVKPSPLVTQKRNANAPHNKKYTPTPPGGTNPKSRFKRSKMEKRKSKSVTPMVKGKKPPGYTVYNQPPVGWRGERTKPPTRGRKNIGQKIQGGGWVYQESRKGVVNGLLPTNGGATLPEKKGSKRELGVVSGPQRGKKLSNPRRPTRHQPKNPPPPARGPNPKSMLFKTQNRPPPEGDPQGPPPRPNPLWFFSPNHPKKKKWKNLEQVQKNERKTTPTKNGERWWPGHKGEKAKKNRE